MDGGAWWAAVEGVANSWTWPSDFTFPFHFHELEKEMATHSSVLAWRTPGTGEPGGLPSMGSHRVGHGWSDLAAAAEALGGLQSLESQRVGHNWPHTTHTRNSQEAGRELECCSHVFQETNSLRRTMQIVECSLLHWRAQGRVSS